MSEWRQKALECAPELILEIQEMDFAPSSIFMELLPITRQAHIDNNEVQLAKIYAFAAWCHRQEDEQLWNAVGVCFYEHLLDREETAQAFTRWIPKEIYFEIRDLLYYRTDDDQIKQLDAHYGYKKKQ